MCVSRAVPDEEELPSDDAVELVDGVRIISNGMCSGELVVVVVVVELATSRVAVGGMDYADR